MCTNLSCALVGAQRVVEAFEDELGVQAGETTDGRQDHASATVECLGGCGYATVVAVDRRYHQHVEPEDVPAIVEEIRWRARSLLLAGADERDLTKLAEYRAIGGYDGVPKARSLTPEALIEELLAANLRGRGGAGFPMGRKASLIDRESAKPKYLVVNADESEPGAFKDREVIARVPHRLIEGCLIAAHAIECKHVFIYIRGEYLAEYEILAAAPSTRRGTPGCSATSRSTVHRGAGAYICGEETALLDSLEGRRGQPRPSPPFPPVQGLYNAPTQINNVCTIATVPAIIDHRARRSSRRSASRARPGRRSSRSPGTSCAPGNYELELGTPMRELIYDHAGGIPDGRELKAVIPGGSSVPALSPDEIDVPLDYDSLRRDRHVLRRRLADRDRRPLLHGAARAALDQVLHARVVREVHALPRGNALDGAAARAARGRRRQTHDDIDLLRLGRLADPRQVALRARRFRRLSGGELPREVGRGVRGPRRARTAAPSTATRRSRESSPRATRMPTTRCTREARWLSRSSSPSRSTGARSSVPKGTGLVEAALAAGVEIPVFCYEPRLGPPVGACRMCLCEVAPGPPKPQAACTLTAAEGMAVKTALTSRLAADAQNATLEFILVNHPLDCPVCDKGGECPLQDLTFRYGPGATRMTFPKRTFEKPIPISPTIALDRERCILCYRCTRFSESVAEDGQLVAVERGAASMIATFEDEPYRAPFSGNVIELCPVGALTSTQYRFEARPWEIQNVPTVCGLCPVGCNISATTREGKVKRILSRNHPEIDEGWLCDKGRFAFQHLHAADRIDDPLRKTASAVRAALVERRARPGRADPARGRQRDRDRALAAARPSSRPTASPGCCGSASARTAPSSPRRSRTGSTPSARRSPRSATRPRWSSSATSRSSSGRRSSSSGSRPPAGTAPRSCIELPASPVDGGGADHRRRRARRRPRDRARRERGLLPAAHAERPRRHRRVELRRRRRARRRRAGAARHLRRRSGPRPGCSRARRARARR